MTTKKPYTKPAIEKLSLGRVFDAFAGGVQGFNLAQAFARTGEALQAARLAARATVFAALHTAPRPAGERTQESILKDAIQIVDRLEREPGPAETTPRPDPSPKTAGDLIDLYTAAHDEWRAAQSSKTGVAALHLTNLDAARRALRTALLGTPALGWTP